MLTFHNQPTIFNIYWLTFQIMTSVRVPGSICLMIFLLPSLASKAKALKCFEEGPDTNLHIISCAYFAFGNAQVCFTINGPAAGEEQSYARKRRGCQYLSRLGTHNCFCLPDSIIQQICRHSLYNYRNVLYNFLIYTT